MYTLVFLPGFAHTIKFGLLFPGATGSLIGTFSLVATLAVKTAPYRRELPSQSVHQTIWTWSTGPTGSVLVQYAHWT